MANTPMVIMWPNSDGSITVSQRQAPSEQMPTLVSNPPRVATADQAGSDLTGTQPKLAFTIEVRSRAPERAPRVAAAFNIASIQRLTFHPLVTLMCCRLLAERRSPSYGRSATRIPTPLLRMR